MAGRDARSAQLGDRDLDPQLFVEARRLVVAQPCFGDHEVDSAIDYRLIAAERSPEELRDADVEVGKEVGVEHHPLRVALAVADAQLAGEGLRPLVLAGTRILCGGHRQ